MEDSIFIKVLEHGEEVWLDGTNTSFRLVEYRELQKARAAAKSANRNAFIATGISIFAIVISAILAFTQLNPSTTINQSDLQALINSNATQRDVRLDNLQMAQILSAIKSSQSNLKHQKQKAILPSNEIQHHDLINRYFEEE